MELLLFALLSAVALGGLLAFLESSVDPAETKECWSEGGGAVGRPLLLGPLGTLPPLEGGGIGDGPR